MVNVKNSALGKRICCFDGEWKEKYMAQDSYLKARIGWQGLTTAEYLDTGKYILITGTDFKNGKVDWGSCCYVEQERYEQDKNIQIKTGDILLTKDGTIGKVAYISQLPGLATLNSGVFVIRPINDSYYPLYFYYVLRSKIFIEFLNKLQAGSTINHLYQKDFVNFSFVAPPTEEQKAIATALSDVDGLIESIEQLIAKKRDMKTAAMQQLLTGERRLQGFSGEWKECQLEQLVNFLKGKGLSKNKLSARGEYECVLYGELYTQYKETITKIHSRTDFNEGISSQDTDVLLPGSTTTTGIDLANASAIKRNSVLLGGDINILRCRGGLKYDSVFLAYYLTHVKRYDIAKRTQGITIIHLYGKQLANLSLYIPKQKEEQSAIGAILTDMDTEIDALEQRLVKAKHIKAGMMQELLTGKTRLVKPVQLTEKASNTHNEYIEDAVIIAILADEFGNANYPLGRMRYTKLSYLLRRYRAQNMDAYLKKAAGPYNPRTKYGGAEKIAIDNQYIAKHKFGKYEGFIAADNIAKAHEYFTKWFGDDALQWLRQFRYNKNDDLELLTTVDMAVEELRADGKEISTTAVKEVLQSNREWMPKLTRATFSDENISRAIQDSARLFGNSTP